VDNVSKSERSRIMACVKSAHTSPELSVRRLVHALGYRYRLHVKTLPGTPDLVFVKLRKIINVSGCFWHMHLTCGRCRIPRSHRSYWVEKLKHNRSRDQRNRQRLRAAGWDVLTIWECQIKNKTRLTQRLSLFLRS
jgi:DNA mismatch endonuclease (patch repair protein)